MTRTAFAWVIEIFYQLNEIFDLPHRIAVRTL